MKKQYMRQVEKELRLPRREKDEVLRDLEEIFASAAEHGETAQQVMERLGTAKEFADSTAAQFGVDNAAPKRRKTVVSFAAALLVAVAALILGAAAKMGEVPAGAIGQADAMTGIQIAGAFAFDALQLLLAVGSVAALLAVFLLFRLLRGNRRS